MAAKAFTGVGSMNTGANWTPTGVPTRLTGDTVTWTTVPTGGQLSCALFTIPSVSVNLSLYDLSDVGAFKISDYNYAADGSGGSVPSVFFPTTPANVVETEFYGIDYTGVAGPNQGALDVVDITDNGTGVGAGGLWQVSALNPGNTGIFTTIMFGPNGTYQGGLSLDNVTASSGGNLLLADITNGGTGMAAGGGWDVSFLGNGSSYVSSQLGYGPFQAYVGGLSINDILASGTGGAAGGLYDVSNLTNAKIFHGTTWGVSAGNTGTLAASTIGTVSGTTNAAPSNVKNGVTIDNVTGTFSGGGSGGGGTQVIFLPV